MNEFNSIEATHKTILSQQTKFWLDEISKQTFLSKRLIKESREVEN